MVSKLCALVDQINTRRENYLNNMMQQNGQGIVKFGRSWLGHKVTVLVCIPANVLVIAVSLAPLLRNIANLTVESTRNIASGEQTRWKNYSQLLPREFSTSVKALISIFQEILCENIAWAGFMLPDLSAPRVGNRVVSKVQNLFEKINSRRRNAFSQSNLLGKWVEHKMITSICIPGNLALFILGGFATTAAYAVTAVDSSLAYTISGRITAVFTVRDGISLMRYAAREALDSISEVYEVEDLRPAQQ